MPGIGLEAVLPMSKPAGLKYKQRVKIVGGFYSGFEGNMYGPAWVTKGIRSIAGRTTSEVVGWSVILDDGHMAQVATEDIEAIG